MIIETLRGRDDLIKPRYLEVLRESQALAEENEVYKAEVWGPELEDWNHRLTALASLDDEQFGLIEAHSTRYLVYEPGMGAPEWQVLPLVDVLLNRDNFYRPDQFDADLWAWLRLLNSGRHIAEDENPEISNYVPVPDVEVSGVYMARRKGILGVMTLAQPPDGQGFYPSLDVQWQDGDDVESAELPIVEYGGGDAWAYPDDAYCWQNFYAPMIDGRIRVRYTGWHVFAWDGSTISGEDLNRTRAGEWSEWIPVDSSVDTDEEVHFYQVWDSRAFTVRGGQHE